jgi:hypothetical protein
MVEIEPLAANIVMPATVLDGEQYGEL